MSVAFKEWAIVCEALGSGRQSVIIRKGGIAEGRQGFAFRHREFLLFPTWFHEQLEKTTLPPGTAFPQEDPAGLDVRFLAVVEWSGLVTDWDKVRALHDFHVLRESVLEERFRYENVSGVHVAFVRVFRLEPHARIAHEKRFGGCRSWLELPEIEGSALVSVLSDEEHERRRAVLARLLGW